MLNLRVIFDSRYYLKDVLFVIKSGRIDAMKIFKRIYIREIVKLIEPLRFTIEICKKKYFKTVQN